MQTGNQISELRNSKIMWQDIGAATWTLSSWPSMRGGTVTNDQPFILPRRQYRTNNFAIINQINIGKLIKKTEKKTCICPSLVSRKQKVYKLKES